MKKTALVLLTALTFSAATVSTASAQTAKGNVAFVNIQQVIAALPGNTNYMTLSKKADADLAKQQQNLQTLMTKANSSPTAANRDAFTKAQQAYATAQKNYQTQLAAAFKPLASKVDAAIAKVAKANGFTVVLDRQVAAQSSLVVYADPSTDLTAAVLKEVKK